MLLDKKRLYERLEKDGLCGIVLTSPSNVHYVSDFDCFAHRVVGTQVYVVVPTGVDKEPSLIFPMVDIDLYLESASWVKQFYCYNQFFINHSGELNEGMEKSLYEAVSAIKAYEDPVEALKFALEEAGLVSGKIAFESRTVPGYITEAVKDSFPGLEFVEAEDLMLDVRSTKTNEEIFNLSQAAKIIEEAFIDALAYVKPGVTEAEIARRLNCSVVERGGTPSFTFVTAGRRSAFTHSTPSAYVIQPDDWLRFDIGCTYKGYYSDIARVVSLGKPAPKVMDYYNAICVGQKAILSNIKPGASIKEAFQAGIDAVKENGIPHFARNHCGHGLGLWLYETPMIVADSTLAFKKNMVFTVELPYYEVGLAGMNVEDIVLVTDDGYKLLTSIDREPFVR